MKEIMNLEVDYDRDDETNNDLFRSTHGQYSSQLTMIHKELN